MENPDWIEIKEVFNQTIDLSSAEREIVLAEHNELIVKEVRELIASHENADAFIDNPIVFKLRLDKDTNVGTTIDNYKILEIIGAGGMGTVYLAERTDLGQKVAVKLIKRGMDTREVLKRFKLERQILSRLNHPNIARLLDAGLTEDGLPYFVMEYIEGESIIKFCENHDFGINERLELFQKVCNAISYAHSNLIVHRDIKPSNIIVTNDGTPKLLDFGIAKLLDNETENTATQARIFTPEYASPEQIKGLPITTATDVYSLGVVLYQLLSGVRPFASESRNYAEIANLVLTVEPQKPSAVVSSSKSWSIVSNTRENKAETQNEFTNPKLKTQNSKLLSGDLDNIVLKSLRKEPERRYQTVNDFSEDIKRHLAGLPVTATSDSTRYRASKFVRRHKQGVAIGSIVGLLILAISGVAIWQAILANRERAKAEARFNDVREIANVVLFDYYDKIKNLPNTIELRQKLVVDMVSYLDKLDAENSNDISLKRDLVKGYQKISEVQFGLENGNIGDSNGAVESAAKAFEIAKQIAEDPNAATEDKKTLADIYISLAGSKGETGDLVADVDLKKKAIAIYQELYEINPNDSDATNNLAKGYFYIATPMNFTGDLDGAIENLQKANLLYEKLSNRIPNDSKHLRNMSLTFKYQAPILLRQGKINEAESVSLKAIEIDQTRVNANPDLQTKYDLSRSCFALAEVLTTKENFGSAEEFATKSIDLVKEVSDENPKNSYYNDSYGRSLKILADIRQKQNRQTESTKLTKQAVEIWELTVAKDPADIFTKLILAQSYAQIGENYLSSTNKVSTQKENIAIAKKWFLKSESIWIDLKKNPHIFKYYQKDSEKVNKAIEDITRNERN
jgi:eukaryotic-like serine/threonine-protein kinase